MVTGKEFYALPEAAQVLGITQRRLLEMLAAKEIEGEQDPNSSRWKIPGHAVHELVPELLPTDQPLVGPQDTTELPTETVQQLVGELDDLQKELGGLKRRLEFAQRAQNTAWQRERGLLLGELEQEREERRREREQAESTLQAERERLLEDQRREHERADELQRERELLLGELEQEREERRREREQAESTLQAERERLLEDQRREHERADELREEADSLREKLETERSKGSWRKRLLGR